MSNDERMYWAAITISLFVVAYSFWVLSMETLNRFAAIPAEARHAEWH